MSPTEPVSPIARWALDPSIVHLNHGSFGGCPRAVLDDAAAWRARLEAAPMRFLVLDWQRELDRARAALAAFVRAPADRLAFTPSATAGVATALHAYAPRLAAGDELLTTDHAYRACRNQLERLAAARGLGIATVAVPLPFDAGALIERTAAAITPRTRLALLDHVTSPTALRLPLEALIAPLAARGVAIVVDGAHAPGQLDLDVGALLAGGVTYYAGNNHKWLCAPKGSGFLVAAAGAPVLPLVTSHGATAAYGPPNRLHAELDWPGTHDPAPHLAVPAAIAAVAAEGGGWPAVLAHNHALALELRARFVDALGGGPPGAPPIAPADSLGAMVAIPVALPPGAEPLALERQLLTDGWEVPIVDFTGGPLVRLSAHLYNHADQAAALAEKLAGLGVRLRAVR
ncbi:MAG TPA: aminotransferase class V-fold PLP-dependent enzyme [Kofleriaceae bacterium]|nr:aminotransferase class V-fold PLP-dependent enzyme [Kofleriaceae bacterium]